MLVARGYKLDFRRAVNSTDEVRMGHLTVESYIEQAAVFRERRGRAADQTMVALCEPARAMIASIVASTAGR
jgi:hypothetical protein